MRNLNKSIRIAYAQGANLEEEVNKFLTAYRTAPHCTTGKAPDEMLFKRSIRTKIAKLAPSDRLDEDVLNKDARITQKGKEYGDDKRNARSSNLKINDKVLLQQKESCKTMTTYEHDPYDIVNNHQIG